MVILEKYMAEKNPFQEYRAEIGRALDQVKERLAKEKEERRHIEYGAYSLERISCDVRKALAEAFGVECGEIEEKVLLVPPPGNIDADFAVGMFPLAACLKRNPIELAAKGAHAISQVDPLFITKAVANGPYINISLDRARVYTAVLSHVAALVERYGESDVQAGKTAVIDYSAPNIAKPMGVGHLRSTIIGESLMRIFRATGSSVVGDNHLGDWGTQFGKLLYAFKEWGDEKEMEANPITYLKDLYVRFGREAEAKPEIVDEARRLFSALEKKEPELVVLWRRFKDLSMLEFDRVYKRLDVSFDLAIGESYFIDETEPLVNECLGKGVCRIDEETGTVIIDSIPDVPSFLLRKKDGSSLYMTRDLATLRFRKKEFDPDDIIYVVGSEQELNFKQLFALAESMGYKGKTNLEHVGFGMVLVEGKKMSTRKGTIVELHALLDESVERAKKTVLEKDGDQKSFSDTELAEIAECIGTSVIVYNDLRQSRKKNISFDWEKMLDPRGESAVYLQYTAVRIQSILRKMGVENGFPADCSEAVFEKESEFLLARKLMFFPRIVIEAQKEKAPHLICGYLEELAQAFNSFYGDVSVIRTEDEALKNSRALLIAAVAQTIRNGLALLNIRVPERM